jgi:putative transposase
VGEGGDEVSVARFIADQRTSYRVPHTVVCALLGVSQAWFYKWAKRAAGPGAARGLHTNRDRRRDTVDRAVAVAFRAARGLHGSPRLHADLLEDGWTVSERTVAESMRRQHLIARRIKRRNGLTRPDKTKAPFPDLVRRDFTADRPNAKWVGDITEIPTGPGGRGQKLYLATVIDLYSRRLLGAATSLRPDAVLAGAALTMAVATRGGREAIRAEAPEQRVIFHSDRGSTYTANSYTALCRRLGVRQSMGRVGSCFDNAAAEAFFSSLEWEVLSRHDLTDPQQAQAVVLDWCYGFYNHQRRHSTIGMMSPVAYEARDDSREDDTASTTDSAALTRDAA